MIVDKGTTEVPTDQVDDEVPADQASLTAIGASFPLLRRKCSFLWVSYNCRLTAYSLYAAVSVGLQVRIMMYSYIIIKSYIVFLIFFIIIRQFGFVHMHALLS